MAVPEVCNQWNCKHTDCENHMSQIDSFDKPIQPVDFREIGMCEKGEVVED